MPASAQSTYDRRALAVSLAAALWIHLALLVWLPSLIPLTSKADQPPEQPTFALGQDQSKHPVRIAWISHKDFQRLQARPNPTKQPALQRWIEPTFEAPPRLDPALAEKSNVQGPKPKVEDTQPEVDSATDGSNSPTAKQQPHSEGQSQATPPTVDRVKDQSKPTSADRTDRESIPTMPEPTDVSQAGKVRVGPGLEIKTVSPRFSAVTRASTLPQNPIARLTFNAQGNVINAQLLRSSGAANVDGPVLSALYKWQATGERLSEMNPPFTHTFRIVLVAQ